MLPVVPFMGRDRKQLETPAEIALYILQYTMANPGHTSPLNEDEQLSLRKLSAECDWDITRIAPRYMAGLQKIFGLYFPNNNVLVNVSVVRGDGTDTSPDHLVVAVTDATTQTLLINSANIILNSDKTVTFKY